jgi:hypothetical protein
VQTPKLLEYWSCSQAVRFLNNEAFAVCMQMKAQHATAEALAELGVGVHGLASVAVAASAQ